MSNKRISLFAVAMLFAAVATAADRNNSRTDARDPSVREAQAARQEARRGRLQDEAPAQLERKIYEKLNFDGVAFLGVIWKDSKNAINIFKECNQSVNM